MWLGGTLLLLGTVGVLATCKIALAVLMALGPVFIVMALFRGTRGLFVGWLKGVVMLAVAPLFAVLAGSLMLELAVPVIASLTQVPGQIDARAAMAFFMIGAVHVALMVMVVKVAATMVGGWSVFGLAPSAGEAGGSVAGSARNAAPAAIAVAPLTPAAQGVRPASPAPSRQITMTGTTPVAANDSGGGAANTTMVNNRTTRIIGGQRPDAPVAGKPQLSRAKGIGSRFRAAPHPSASRHSENKQ